MSNVLLIEDNDDDIELARRAFEKAGRAHEVHIAQDGAQALDYLFGRGVYADHSAASSVNLVLLDLNLPKTSGLDVLRQIRLNPSTQHIPVVVLTVSRKEPDLLQSFTMGVVDYLIKPLDPNRFMQIYRKYVRIPPA
jgi:two-component system, response regulator